MSRGEGSSSKTRSTPSTWTFPASSCLDVGASTGGFTDCLLQRGAAHVISLDVAYGQIDDGMRNHDQVTVIERLNARDLLPTDLDYRPELAVIDVSFISLEKVLRRSGQRDGR